MISLLSENYRGHNITIVGRGRGFEYTVKSFKDYKEELYYCPTIFWSEEGALKDAKYWIDHKIETEKRTAKEKSNESKT